MRFDETGFFWEPFRYVSQRAARTPKSDAAPRVMPPIPETGWKPRAHFPDLSRAKVISLDAETCDPDLLEKGPGVRRGAYIVGASVATDDGFKAYYPVAHSMGENLDRAAVLAYLKTELRRAAQPKVGANLLYDLDFLAEAGVPVAGPCYDVLYADPLINEYESSYSLEACAQRRLGTGKETPLLYQWCADAYGGAPDGKQRSNIWRAPVSLVGPYAEQDALLPLQLIKAQTKILREMGSAKIFEMECGLIPMLLQMRRRGVPVNLTRCKELDDELSSKIELLQSEVGIDVYAGEQIRLLCDREQIEYPKTELGNPSFTKPWLLSHPHPKLQAISELRKLYKMRDTFIRGSLLNSHINGRVHCEFHPLRSDDYGTVSGRFSSSHPNLQQIPKRDEYWGPRIRECFVPDEDRAWMCNDLSQIEFRLGVHYGKGRGVEEVRELYRKDPKTDFYKVAQNYTALPRFESKSISLGTLYGMGPNKFARMTGKSRAQAREDFEQFNERLPFMRATYDYYGEEAERFGFVTTIGGRICHLDPGFEHKALNRKLQGSCADWIKQSMLSAYQAGLFEVLEIYLTVHDELDSGIPPTQTGIDAAQHLYSIMRSAYPLNVPVQVECEIGRSWGTLTKTLPATLITPQIQQCISAVCKGQKQLGEV